MYRVLHDTFLVRVFALLMTFIFSVCVGPPSPRSAGIDPESCDRETMICANLYFYGTDDVLLRIVQGTDSFTIEGVTKVVQRGQGCYTITYEKNFSGSLQTADDLCSDLNYNKDADMLPVKTLEMGRTWKIK